MAKKYRGESAYGRIELSELSTEQASSWKLRVVSGDKSHFTRPNDSNAVDAQQPIDDAVEHLTIRTPTEAISSQKIPEIGLRCSTCNLSSFDSLREQYQHFKSAWHCANLKRKARGSSILTEIQHMAKVSESVRDDDSSMSSGSSSGASDVEEQQQTTTTEPVVEFTDGKSVFKVYKTILLGNDTEKFNPYTALDHIRTSSFRWAIFLLRAGRFAGGVFEKDKALVHKTFQRYTTRRKQGGSQSSHDSSNGHAKSAGATLRRYNEAALKKDVSDVLVQWKEYLKDVELIFISSGKNDRSTFFTGKVPVLSSDDSRLKRIPFATSRPSFEEVCRVRSELSSIKFSPLPDPLPIASATKSNRFPATSNKKQPTTEATPSKSETIEEEEPVVELPFVIQLVKDGDFNCLKALWTNKDVEFDVNAVDTVFMTALHHAVEQNWIPAVEFLLDHGANPSLIDLRGRPAYLLCTTKAMRDVFRRFMATFPDAWDYSTSQIPSGLTTEMEQKKKEKEAEKRKRAKERKKQQKKQENERLEQEKQAQEALEREIAAGMACDMCGKYAGKSPFSRLDFKYCSTECVQAHKRKLMSDAAAARFGQ